MSSGGGIRSIHLVLLGAGCLVVLLGAFAIKGMATDADEQSEVGNQTVSRAEADEPVVMQVPDERAPMNEKMPIADELPPHEATEVESDDDAPYGAGAVRGSTRLAIGDGVPLDWIRECLSAVDTVEQLSVARPLTPELIALIAEFQNVESLWLGNITGMSPEALDALGSLHGVHEVLTATEPLIYTTGSTEGEAEFTPFAARLLDMPDMSALEIDGNINDGLLMALSRSPSITTLRLSNLGDLRRAREITTNGLLAIGEMTQLRELRLSGFTLPRHEIDLTQLSTVLGRLPHLEVLDVSGWSLSDEHLEGAEPALARLRELYVGATRLTDDFYAKMDSSWALERLRVSSAFGDTGATAAGRLPHLRELFMSGTAVTDAGLAGLARGGTSLAMLDLTRCTEITDAGLDSLRTLPTLERVLLNYNTKLSGGAIVSLAATNSLAALDVSHLHVVNKEFMTLLLTQAPSLRTVVTWACRNLTDENRAKLASAYPGVDIR